MKIKKVIWVWKQCQKLLQSQTYKTLVTNLFSKGSRPVIPTRRLVVVECLLKNPCWFLDIRELVFKKDSIEPLIIVSYILQTVEVREMGL